MKIPTSGELKRMKLAQLREVWAGLSEWPPADRVADLRAEIETAIRRGAVRRIAAQKVAKADREARKDAASREAFRLQNAAIARDINSIFDDMPPLRFNEFSPWREEEEG